LINKILERDNYSIIIYFKKLALSLKSVCFAFKQSHFHKKNSAEVKYNTDSLGLVLFCKFMKKKDKSYKCANIFGEKSENPVLIRRI